MNKQNKRTYSIQARKRVVKMEKGFQNGKEGTIVTKGDGKKKFMNFKKSKVDRSSPYKRKAI